MRGCEGLLLATLDSPPTLTSYHERQYISRPLSAPLALGAESYISVEWTLGVHALSL